MIEHHITVPRTARYYSIGNPDAHEVWFVCHGYAQLARYFIRSFEAIDDGSRFIVAPEALNRYYFESAPGVHAPDARIAATWMTREDREHEITDYVAYLDRLHETVVADGARDRIVALGFSQGGATVSRWAANGRAHIDHVILWSSSLAAELAPEPSTFRGASLTIAIGDADEYLTHQRVADEDQRLRASGLDHRLHVYAGGHRIASEPLVQLAQRLRPDSRS